MFRRDVLYLAAALVTAALSASAQRAKEKTMRKLMMFNQVSLDGFFTDGSGDMSWAHSRDNEEWNRFTNENAGGEAEFLFGRKTYELMASFWPTPQALTSMPAVAKAMNETRKTVFSRSLGKADWQNTRLVKGDLEAEVRRMKSAPGPGILIMGSGQIVAQLTQAGLIDEFQFVTVPVVIGSGRPLFEGVTAHPRLHLTKTRSFSNGNVVSWYRLARETLGK
jgi:dihydrofolate reductase